MQRRSGQRESSRSRFFTVTYMFGITLFCLAVGRVFAVPKVHRIIRGKHLVFYSFRSLTCMGLCCLDESFIKCLLHTLESETERWTERCSFLLCK